MKTYLYPYGLPYSLKLHENLVDLNERVFKKNKPVVIVVCGQLGEGKTTLMTQVLDTINKLNGKEEISLDFNEHPQLAMGGAQFKRNLVHCRKLGLPCIGYDEAGDYRSTRAMTKFNYELNRIFDTFRAFKIIVVLALPDFHKLDSTVFDNGLVRLLLRCRDRGVNDGTFQAYGPGEIGYLRYWNTKLAKGIKYLSYGKVNENFYGHFLDLPPERAKLLDRISTTDKEKIAITSANLYTYDDIATRVRRSRGWVQQKLLKWKVKYDVTIKNRRYFKEEALRKVQDHIMN